MKSNSFIVVSLVMLTSFAGCDSSTSVHGTVTLDGEPIRKGAIAFRPKDGRGRSLGAMITNGHYEIEDAAPGQRVAVVSAVREAIAATTRDEAMKLAAKARAEGRSSVDALRADMVPADAPGNSQIVEIKRGSQTLDFAISTE